MRITTFAIRTTAITTIFSLYYKHNCGIFYPITFWLEYESFV